MFSLPVSLRALLPSLLGLILIFAGVTSASAEAAAEPDPAARWAPGSPEFNVAQQLAAAHWGGAPCSGQVQISWGEQEANINARSSWANPTDPYGAPAQNFSCSVVFNPAQRWDWPKFCTVFIHEYGHLSGQPHGADGPDVMSPFYRGPAAECDTPAPTAEPAPPPPAAEPAPPVVQAPPAAVAPVKPTVRAKRSAGYSCRYFNHSPREHRACINRVKARAAKRAARAR